MPPSYNMECTVIRQEISEASHLKNMLLYLMASDISRPYEVHLKSF